MTSTYVVSDHYAKQFTSNTELLIQRMGPKLLPYVQSASYQGDSAQIVKQFGAVEFNEATGRFEDTVWSEIEHKQRWIFPRDYDLALPVDKRDEIRMIGDLQSPYVKAMAVSYGRKIDDIIIDAMFASARTGVSGGDSTAHDTTNQRIAVGFASAGNGLTVEKLREARRIFLANEVDLEREQAVIAVKAKQLDDMLGQVEVTSTDYAAVKALVSGQVDTFMGFKFIHYEALDLDASSYARVPVWLPSGFHMGTWNSLETDIGPRRDKKNTMQVFMKFTAAVTRVEEKKVVEILCSEA